MPKEKLEQTDTDDGRTVTSTSTRIKTLAQLLEAAEVDPAQWTVRAHTVNAWEQNSAKDGLVTLHQVKAVLEPSAAPVRAAPLMFDPPIPRPAKVREGKLVLIIPDTQHGARWLDPRRRAAVTTHDQQAIEIALAVAADLQPDIIAFQGDDIDAAELSSYRQDWTVKGTLQMQLDMLHYNLGRFRMECPHAEIHMRAGNHDDRPKNYIQDKAPVLDGIRVANTDIDPFAVPALLRLDELHINWKGPYKADKMWLHEDVDPLAITHAGKLRADSASSSKATLAATEHHISVGHEHRSWLVSKTLWGPFGPREIQAMSAGALVRLGGIVPGVSCEENWQQALGLAWLEDECTTMHLIPIKKGAAKYGFRNYHGPDGLLELAEATGYGQLWDGRDALMG